MKTGLMAVALAGVLGSGAVSTANARFDGNELLMQCRNFVTLVDGGTARTDVHFDAGVCGGFVQGVANTVYFYSDELKKDLKFCIPDSAPAIQLVRVVVKYLKDNPKNLNLDRMTLVWRSFMDAYPCK
ncbi:MAG: Rap1a/Tai family immunity protein [Pseudomonas sp.]|uniref:Rap1a/Tai family immunity protein n=1 Tax=Pseudomonas sp. TaxID=306 RepID=UPI0027293D41|nr:Rap1a/Tai family immunity protein [Pseudomonas sp.]MDO9332383.1 Rap1a/Tai family immunity protein [Pseudomonas sp.]